MRPSARRLFVALLVGLLALQARGLALPGGPSEAGAATSVAVSHDATSSLTIQAAFRSFTSLRVSSSHLRFEVDESGALAQASVEFTAAARTHTGGEVLLTIEPDGGIEAPDGADASTLEVSLEAGGPSVLSENAPRVAGKWVGSGVRQGRLSFTLRGARVSGAYALPVRFVLAAP